MAHVSVHRRARPRVLPRAALVVTFALVALLTTATPAAADGAGSGAPPDHGPPPAWSVRLDVRRPTLWPGQSTGLLAVANRNVASSPYSIYLVEVTWWLESPQIVARCDRGRRCRAHVTDASETIREYVAVVARTSETWPAPDVQAQSEPGTVTWSSPTRIIGITPAVSPTTVPVGAAVSVTVNGSGADIGPTPYWWHIFDVTTDRVVARCKTGLSCTATIIQPSAGTHVYQATLSRFSAHLPGVDTVQRTYVAAATWSDSGWQVSVSYSAEEGLVATANRDVGPTPYSIIIIEPRLDAPVTYACTTGAVCRVPRAENECGAYFLGFVAVDTGGWPYRAIQATSPVVAGGAASSC